MPSKKEKKGCGCASIPISLIIVLLGAGYWGFTQLDRLGFRQFLTKNLQLTIPTLTPTPAPSQPQIVVQSSPQKVLRTSPPTIRLTDPSTEVIPPASPLAQTSSPVPVPVPAKQTPSVQALLPKTAQKFPLGQTPWEKKLIRGIYLSRYQATNNAAEQTIRERVRYYHSQGINTLIHGVWGNGCTMYNSAVMQQTFGFKSCPNQFQDQWLNWLIDEAHKQGMQVHAYFEKGIKIDKNSPIFNLAVSKRWIVPGVDKTYSGIDHYVLDVEIPEVARLFRQILVEFVQKYPNIDAVQWDDYLGYYANLPGKIDRTAHLTHFVQQIRADMKKANPHVSFDLCHHNPYWAKRYFAADWQHWNIDRVFIQTYNDANFSPELDYAQNYAGVAISDRQLYRLTELIKNPKIKSVLVFPYGGKPEVTAAVIKKFTAMSH